MKVVEVFFSDDERTAILILKPTWLARLFGCRRRYVKLVKDDKLGWRSAVTGEIVGAMSHGAELRYALEAIPVTDASVERHSADIAKCRVIRSP